jgi:tRNA-splicing ligase RtcB (3'-phosphate/5'-hydroxy nucleic acid ligase)
MTPDYATILAHLDTLDEFVAKRLAGRLRRMRCADEPGFLEAIAALLAAPEQPQVGLWAELEAVREEVAKESRRHRLIEPRSAPLPYKVFGPEGIEESAHNQMAKVMSLGPVVSGALMPDAHVGFGMPIGGVAATEGAVMPFAVGVDIGCRMHLTVFAESASSISAQRERLKISLLNGTYFGRSLREDPLSEHPLLDDLRFKRTEKFCRSRGTREWAAKQFGSSGSGNHFVEFGEIVLTEPADSGSRALGFRTANFFTELAGKMNKLPKEYEELAWLAMDTEEGQAYWEAMELAGDYSAANHLVIHETIIRLAGLTPVRAISNHHNYAWKETHGGKELYVHRKGATPAAPGVLGIIPGSMATPGFLVRGKGGADSLSSASHGAGRRMSRRDAFKSITEAQRDQELLAGSVELLGGGLDEAPGAYKDIHSVMAAQSDLVDILAEFHPRIVRMAGRDELDREEGG